jgi:hypothetical protein
MVEIIGCSAQLAAERSGNPNANEIVERLPPIIWCIVLRRISTPSLEDGVFLIKPLKPSRRIASVQFNSSTGQIAFDCSANKL